MPRTASKSSSLLRTPGPGEADGADGRDSISDAADVADGPEVRRLDGQALDDDF
jgi:hypothetical protein